MALATLASMPAPMALDQLLEGYVECGALPHLVVAGLSLDSRDVASGDAYIALQGAQSHGIEYASAAVSRGAVVVLVDSEDSQSIDAQASLAVPVVAVPALAQNTGLLASRYFDHASHKLPICGVTGTDGKTSVCCFVTDALRQLGYSVGYIGTIGWGLDGHLEPNPLTTPDAISLHKMINMLYRRGAQFITLEVSSHALVQGRVNGVAFDVAVLTNLGRDHLDYHGDLSAYKTAKGLLFDWPRLSTIVVNVDDDFGRELLVSHAGSVNVTGYSTLTTNPTSTGAATSSSQHQPALLATDVQVDQHGLTFSLLDKQKQYPIHSNLLGGFNVDNLLACFAVLRAFGITTDAAVATLDSIVAVPGRMERFGALDKVAAVVDFAHTPQALQAALVTLRSHCIGRLWVVFGCGGDRDPGKRKLMGEIAAREADVVVVTDDNPRSESSINIIEQILQGVPKAKEQFVIADRAQAIKHALSSALDDDWVLIAGKGHEDYQIVGDQRLAYSDRKTVQALTAGVKLGQPAADNSGGMQ